MLGAGTAIGLSVNRLRCGPYCSNNARGYIVPKRKTSRDQIMKVKFSTVFAILILLCHCCAFGSGFEDESTPIEQSDTQSIDQINSGDPSEGGPTPIEQSDTQSIDQINSGDPSEGGPTPIEQSDTESIDQINSGDPTEGGPTPIEQSDTQSIDQINNW
jgi:hypothetical protein